jgi:hypothetical protein
VYARNFADGHGFVYNVGGEVVEGFTSFLWTLLCAGFAAVFQSMEVPLYLFNLMLGLLTVWSCLKRTHHPALFVLMLAAAPAWFAWCQVTLMETGLWCLIITLLGFAVAEKRQGAILALLPLMLITRPESMLWGAWVVLLVFVMAEPTRRLKTALPVGLVYLLTLALLVGFRMSYFGHPVPNTYYAKITPGLFANLNDGRIYLWDYITSSWLIRILMVLLVIVLVRFAKEKSTSFYLALFLLPGIVIPVLVGGDHFGAFRFYQPIWPLLCLIGVNEWSRLTAGRVQWLGILIMLGFLIGGWDDFPEKARIKHEWLIAEQGRANGATLVQLFEDLDTWPTVGAITAGGNKLGYPGPVYDLMGLNWVEMAHAPGDAANFKNHTGFTADVFYRNMPDIIYFGDEQFDLLVLNGLHDEPRFRAQYKKCRLYRNGTKLHAWFRKDFLKSLSDSESPAK